jgi:2-polyprenyl-3-methyl-5-hydroxy-6-metoxy-1,4-benzoquinol methylase
MKRSPLLHDRVFAGDFAEEYARKHRRIAEKFGREMAEKLALCGFREGRILDAGCGAGATAIVLARTLPQSEVVGIDLSDPLLELAIQAAQDAGVIERVTFERADVQQMPYDDDSFDAIINLQMLHIVADPIPMLDEQWLPVNRGMNSWTRSRSTMAERRARKKRFGSSRPASSVRVRWMGKARSPTWSTKNSSGGTCPPPLARK